MSILSKANQFYRSKKYKQAELLYEKVLTSNTSDVIRKVCLENILRINKILHQSHDRCNANCIATASNSKFFNSSQS